MVDMSNAIVRLALVAPTGSGKTTTAWLMQKMTPGAVVVSVAQPLHDVEEFLYRLLARPSPSVTGTQDGVLLQSIRDLLFMREPQFLSRIFKETVDRCSGFPLVVNDDCRLGSKPTLDTLGFTYVWIEGDHGRRRMDATPAEVTDHAHDAVIPRSMCRYVISNRGGVGDLVTEIRHLLKELGLDVAK
ncbi:ATP-binding protein [Micromonospora sp. NIE79]|uniref:ATP-binding protein n=1 Tax=Micromonospora trifolii TaxID=2911208 RepID=A0ABS9N1N8_9ACTN|nr:ATP-binding protein [Micromonospora trifolii]MCG5443869.1 ATP-binding protein [Micromonospora trifolii]